VAVAALSVLRPDSRSNPFQRSIEGLHLPLIAADSPDLKGEVKIGTVTTKAQKTGFFRFSAKRYLSLQDVDCWFDLNQTSRKSLEGFWNWSSTFPLEVENLELQMRTTNRLHTIQASRLSRANSANSSFVLENAILSTIRYSDTSRTTPRIRTFDQLLLKYDQLQKRLILEDPQSPHRILQLYQY